MASPPRYCGERAYRARSGSTTSNAVVKSSSRLNSSVTFAALPRNAYRAARHGIGQSQLAQGDTVEGGAVERDGGIGTIRLAVGEIGERAVLQRQGVALANVGKHPVHHNRLALCLLAVEAHTEKIEEQVEREAAHDVALGAPSPGRRSAPQLQRSEEVGIAPSRRLRLIAHLFQRISAKLTRGPVLRPREHHLAHGLRHPAILALPKSSRSRAIAASAPPMYATYFLARSTGGSGLRLAGLASYQPR